MPSTVSAFFLYFAKKQPWAFLTFFIAPCFIVLETNVIPYSIKMLIDGISAYQGDRADILPVIMPALLLGGGAWFVVITIFRLQNWWQCTAIPRFEAQIRMEVLSYIVDHSYRYFSNQLSGNIANKISDLPKSLDAIRMILCWNVMTTASALLVTLVMMFLIQPIFAAILAIWMVITITVLLLLSKYIHRASLHNAEDKSHLSGRIVDMITNNLTITLFARKRYELGLARKTQKQEQQSNQHVLTLMNRLRLWVDGSSFITIIAIAALLITAWQDAAITTGDFIFVILATNGVMYQMWFLGNMLPELFREFGIAHKALELIREPHELTDAKGAKALHITKGHIQFEHVTFGYDKTNPLFNSKNITLNPGQKVGLVGFSGSGKTSFVNLILRFFDIDAGRILIDSQDISTVTRHSLRKNIAMIPQDPTLFHRSLEENIRYGNPNATKAQIIQAAKAAHCHEFIQELPQGYNTLVGERGVKLSGGQRQRIAIARAMLKNAPLIILDEATSALDSVTEEYIQKSLLKLMKNKTTIVIAHRLATLTHMDRILVFNQGQIVEDGTHQQLLKQNGHYAKLWQMQAGGFLPDKPKVSESRG